MIDAGQGLRQRGSFRRGELGSDRLAAGDDGQTPPPRLAHPLDPLVEQFGPGRAEVAAAGEEQPAGVRQGRGGGFGRVAADHGDADLGVMPAQRFEIRHQHRLVADMERLGTDVGDDHQGMKRELWHRGAAVYTSPRRQESW